jgi:hypothetical protein
MQDRELDLSNQRHGQGDATQMSKRELIEATKDMTGGNIKKLSLDQLHRLITVALHVSDLCLNEIEDRRALLRRLRRRDHTDPPRVARSRRSARRSLDR